ncbi:MAG: nuclear transport factor 2 family protein [Sphingomonadales bacterium]|nr:MAG: nuclear transport factor 2 family protein [Sphingomonadales bacterium]
MISRRKALVGAAALPAGSLALPAHADTNGEVIGAIDRLVALEDIRNLKARRIRAMDEKRWSDYEAMHAEDHISMTYAAGPAVGTRANTARLSATLDGVITVHHAHTPELELLTANTAQGVWAMEDMLFWKEGEADHWLHGFGHYHERYRKGPNGWQFIYRQLTRLHVKRSPGALRFKAQ